ncbi:MAG: hypothetical protein JST89_22995 [Cyanobacteria bacterium SZAS-4]|nr:hypothetical protein [Cyanobacteria bacterium SZAS-4]
MSTIAAPDASATAQNAQNGNQASNEEAQKVLKSISKLVAEYFPRAKITTTGNSLHFEYKVHERMHPYNRREVLSPELDGILGDVELKSGGPSDRIVGFLERPETVHSVLLMAPYSASDKTWLSTRLVFQPITPLDFMDSFKKIIASYDHPADSTDSVPSADSQDRTTNPSLMPVPVPAVTPVTQTPMVPDAKDPTPPAEITQSADTRLSSLQGLSSNSPGLETTKDDQQKNISKEINPIAATDSNRKSEGAAGTPMDKYTYPEGRFKVMLPGSPQVKYTDQSGMRMVDYLYAVPEGTFNVSYVILPEPPPNLKTSQLLDNMSQSVVNSLKGLHTRQYPSSLQGFPGCQLEMPELANKAGQSARFRIYIVQNFIYIVGLAGKKDWLNSPNAKEFLDTFQVNIAPTAAEKASKQHQDAERERQDRARQQELQRNNTRTQSQKDAEKWRADYTFNRRHDLNH